MQVNQKYFSLNFKINIFQIQIYNLTAFGNDSLTWMFFFFDLIYIVCDSFMKITL